jgi:hypothetical protein
MRQISKQNHVDDRNSLESLDDLEESVSKNKGSPMTNVAYINSAASNNLQFEGIDLTADGKLKICFTQGVDLLIDPNSKNLTGRGVTLRIGNSQTTVLRSAEGLQLNVDGFVINLKR